MTGVDPADAATKKSEGEFETDYTKYLQADALKGARIGIARDFLGADPDVDWVVDAALDAMRKAGATLVDVRYPKWLLDAKGEFYNADPLSGVHGADRRLSGDARADVSEDTRGDDRARQPVQRHRAPTARSPNPSRWSLFKREAESGTLDDYRYTAVRDYALPMVRAVVEGMFAAQQLDAIVYPTASRRPALIAATPAPAAPRRRCRRRTRGDRHRQPHRLSRSRSSRPASPATTCRSALSFLGRAFSEAKLLSLGYSFEQATQRAPPAGSYAGAGWRGHLGALTDNISAAVIFDV